MGWTTAVCLSCFAGGFWLRGTRICDPEALIRFHRHAVRLWWRWLSRNRGGRPRISPELIALIRRLSRENPLWGAPRIHGELLKLGFRLAQSTVSRYMLSRHGRPMQDWKTFLSNNAEAIGAIDMLSVYTIGFRRLYAVVVLGHGRRAILHVEVTDHPTAEWLSQQIAEAFPWNRAPAFLVRDNDGAYGFAFRRKVRAMGIHDKAIRPHSPWQNGHVERVIGSIRRECLDHILIFNANHLRRVLKAYADYYNNIRTHLALGKDAPNSRSTESVGDIVSTPVLGGVHRRYQRTPPE